MPISPISIRFQKPTIPSFKSKVVWEADNKKSPEELKNLIDEFEENLHRFRKLGHGKCSEVYELKPYELVIKKQYTTKPKFDYFSNESTALKNIPDDFINTQKYTTRVKTEKNNYYLISTFRPGESINFEKNPLTPEYLRLLMNSLFQLDKANIYHFDLSNNNILVCDAGANIIDYQWAKKFKPFNAQYSNEKLGINFPQEIIPSNAQNYEISGFSSYIHRLNQKYGKEYTRNYVKNYIKAKSKYHENRYDYFKQLAKKEGLYLIDTPKTPNAHNKDIYNPLKFEKALEKVYKNPTEDVIDIELMRTEFLRADKKAFYFNDPNNADENLNTFNAVPYLANSLLAGRNFQIKLKDFAEKYKDDKYMSRYIKYNQKIADYSMNNFCRWGYNNLEFFKKVAINNYDVPLDRRIDYKKNNIKHFENFKTLEPLLTSNLKRERFFNNPLKVFSYEEQKKFFNNLKVYTNNLSELKDLKNYVRGKDRKTSCYQMVKDIQIGVDAIEKALVENRPVDALCMCFTTLAINSDLDHGVFSQRLKNSLFYHTYNNTEKIEDELLSMINKIRSALLDVTDAKIPNYNINDFQLTTVPTFENDKKTENKIRSFLEKLWLKIEDEVM